VTAVAVRTVEEEEDVLKVEEDEEEGSMLR
jgi:hypothetical protein